MVLDINQSIWIELFQTVESAAMKHCKAQISRVIDSIAARTPYDNDLIRCILYFGE